LAGRGISRERKEQAERRRACPSERSCGVGVIGVITVVTGIIAGRAELVVFKKPIAEPLGKTHEKQGFHLGGLDVQQSVDF
jgi:hypothetical protein